LNRTVFCESFNDFHVESGIDDLDISDLDPRSQFVHRQIRGLPLHMNLPVLPAPACESYNPLRRQVALAVVGGFIQQGSDFL
jgi:hypothetical protein